MDLYFLKREERNKKIERKNWVIAYMILMWKDHPELMKEFEIMFKYAKDESYKI